MRVLGIETSCDETAAAVVKTTAAAFTVIEQSNVIHSQIDIHKEFGGVVPNLAKREHEKLLVPITIKAIQDSGQTLSKHSNNQYDTSSIRNLFEKNQTLLESVEQHSATLFQKPRIDLIATTNGPGLEPALWVGVTLARALSVLWDIPIIGVDHMQGHICANFIQTEENQPPVAFPAIALTISGGHTQLVYMKEPLHYQLLGETVDDAAGEAFDKVARMLSLSYPGGPIISRLAEQGDKEKYSFPRPMMHTKDLNFSFSGLKTAVLYLTKKMAPEEIQQEKEHIAASFQQAIIDVVTKKTIKAIIDHDAKSLLVGGGVIANKQLREQLGNAIQQNTNATYHIPLPQHATDNAAMIAACGALEHTTKNRTDNPHTLSVDANKTIA